MNIIDLDKFASFYLPGLEEVDREATLLCRDHPGWWANASCSLPQLIAKASDHLREDHRVHVESCICRERVTDGRCLP